MSERPRGRKAVPGQQTGDRADHRGRSAGVSELRVRVSFRRAGRGADRAGLSDLPGGLKRKTARGGEPVKVRMICVRAPRGLRGLLRMLTGKKKA